MALPRLGTPQCLSAREGPRADEETPAPSGNRRRAWRARLAMPGVCPESRWAGVPEVWGVVRDRAASPFPLCPQALVLRDARAKKGDDPARRASAKSPERWPAPREGVDA